MRDNWNGGRGYDFAVMEGGSGSKNGCFGAFIGICAAPLILAALAWFVMGAAAQDHQHPPQDADIHDKFYSAWMIPNGDKPRTSSCCSKQDCFPTTFKTIRGVLHAERNGRFEPFPESLLEENQEDPRESPDGRSHACYYGGRWLCGARGGAS